MKITLSLSILSFLLFAFNAKSSSSLSTDLDADIDAYTGADTDTVVALRNDPVVDVNNQGLETGTNYYIVAANDNSFTGHGFERYSKFPHKTCPHYNIVLDNSRGSPLKFSHAGGQKTAIQASSYLNIEFSDSSNCGKPLVWKVDDKDRHTNQWFITTSGEIGNFGDKTVRNWFQFVKVGANIYNIIYCPDLICKTCTPKCQNVSHYSHKDAVFLALSEDRPLDVKFEKA